jgi:hypothetical protein
MWLKRLFKHNNKAAISRCFGSLKDLKTHLGQGVNALAR